MNYIKKLKGIIYRILGLTDINSLKKLGLNIGNNVSIQQNVFIDPSHCWLISIESNCTIAQNVIILAHDASTKRLIGYTKIGKVSIGEGTFIGAGSIILPGVKIGKNSIVGAGSIVTKDIPEYSVVGGNPAQIIGSQKEFIKKHKKALKETISFPEEGWTIQGNISKENKNKMKKLLNNKGYVE